MESAATMQVRIFLLFFIIIFLSCFGFVAVVLGNPETRTVSHSFPKPCAALQRKFEADAAYRAGRRYVFGLASRERITPQWHCLRFCSCDATPRAESGSGRSLRRSSASQLDER